MDLESAYIKLETEKLKEKVVQAKRVLLCTHRNPDGDGLGALLGLRALFLGLGKSVVSYCPDSIPHPLRFLPGIDTIATSIEGAAPFELTIVLDTSCEEMFPDGFPQSQIRGQLVIIDHHMTQQNQLDVLEIKYPAAAVGEIVYDLASACNWPINRDGAVCLYTSLVSDTSGFKYASTTPRTHYIAAKLLEHGVSPFRVATNLYETYSLCRQQLLGKVLNTLEVDEQLGVAYLICRRTVLESVGATSRDLDGIVNYARGIQGVEVAVLFKEENSGIKVVLRSKGNVDVSTCLVGFGCVGQKNAGSCLLESKVLDVAVAEVKSAIGQLMGV